MLQLAILVLQLLQLFGIPSFHATILGLPAVIGLLRDAVLAAQIRRAQSCFALLQDGNDLLWAVSCAFHWCSPLLGSENHILGGSVFGGYVRCYELVSNHFCDARKLAAQFDRRCQST